MLHDLDEEESQYAGGDARQECLEPKALGAHAPDGQITKEGAQIVHDVLAAFLPEVKAANVKVEDTYDNRFVEAALKKFQGKM